MSLSRRKALWIKGLGFASSRAVLPCFVSSRGPDEDQKCRGRRRSETVHAARRLAHSIERFASFPNRDSPAWRSVVVAGVPGPAGEGLEAIDLVWPDGVRSIAGYTFGGAPGRSC